MTRFKKIILTIGLSLLSAVMTYAQHFQGLDSIDELADIAQGVGKSVVDVAFILSGIAAAVMLIPAGIKAWKGEAQSKDAIVSVGLGALAIFIILGIIEALMAFS